MAVMNVRHDPLTLRPPKPVVALRAKARAPERDLATALQSVPAFRTLGTATVSRLSAGAQIDSVPRGAALFAAGADCPGLYIVASGRIMLSIGGSGTDRKVIRLADPGDVIGLTATLLGETTFLAAEALVDSKVVLIARDVLLERATHDAHLARALANIAARHTQVLAHDLEAVSLRSGRERIANYLLDGARGDAATPPAA